MLAIGGMPGTIALCRLRCTCTLPSEYAYAPCGDGNMTRIGLGTDFPSILPALAFSLDMFQKTGSNYGVNEVLLASVLGSIVFSLFSAQPLVIVGVTGPITVFN